MRFVDSRIWIALLVLALAPVALARCHDEPSPEVKKAFANRLDEYLKLRNQVRSKNPAPKQSKDPAQIAARQDALAEGIRQARHAARQGDVFGKEIAACLTELVRAHLTAAAKSATREGNPAVEGGDVEAKVNARYPSDAPLSTVPPSLLRELPELPETLEYRFVGRTMVLYDAEAALIVDFIPRVTT